MHGHDESKCLENPDVFTGLVDFVASLDAALQENLQTSTVFKGTSKIVQNELLDFLSVLKECITEEIKSADFDETMDTSTCQLVLLIHYIDKLDKASRTSKIFF